MERREGSEKEFSFQYNIHLIRMQYGQKGGISQCYNPNVRVNDHNGRMNPQFHPI